MAGNNENPPPYSPPPPGFKADVATGQLPPQYQTQYGAPYPQGGATANYPPGSYPSYPDGGAPKGTNTAYGAYPMPPPGHGTSAGTTVVVQQGARQPIAGQPVVIVRGGNCPRCLTGVIVEDFTCCGIFLAIFFFPLGLLCCLLLRTRYCNQCNYTI